MRQLHPNWTSNLVQFGPAALDCLDRNGNVPGAFTITNTCKDGNHGWIARGSSLEVFTMKTGQRVAAWCFGAILKDTSTVITAIAEYTYDRLPHLLVATTSASTQTGLLSIFDIRTAKVTKAIEIPNQITAVEPVASVGVDQTPNKVHSEHLRHFRGVIAVGTQGGHVYMLDLNLDDETDKSDEVRPNSVLFLDPRLKDVEGRRISAIAKRKHLCLELNDESHHRGYFHFHRPDRSILKSFLSENVSVTSILYCKQTASLVIGFSFGSFQLWSLNIPVLEFSSRLQEDMSPITHFTYQEPENDPRNFVYLWVAHSPLPMETIEDQGASMSLYQLAYSEKHWHEGLGYIFEKIQSVGQRFEHVLTTNPFNSSEEDYSGSRILSCYTIQDAGYTVPDRSDSDDSFDDGSFSPDLSLCAFVWESAPTDPQVRSLYYLAIFDMNRWYHAQMPHSLRYTGLNLETCPYLAFYSLEDISEACAPDSIMSVYVGQSTLARYQSCIVPVPEQHLYPSSLAFDAISITEGGVLLSKFPGQQREIIAEILRVGPQVLKDPTDLYNLCMFAGLLPRSLDLSISGTISSLEKRAAVLNIMLEHNQVSFITACIHEWATGELTQVGCTMRFLLDWAWSRVGHIKESLDKLCVVLYDWSGIQLDAAATSLLHQHQVSLQHLTNIMDVLSGVECPSTEQGQADLDTRVMVVRLIENHLAVVVWSYSEGFLPEVSEDEALSDNRYAFPQHMLKDYFAKRRHEIRQLNSEMQGTELLMIDGIVDQAGEALQYLWEREGSAAGHYPPLSFHAVMNMYLLEGVPLVVKHSIFFYLLCDLMYLTMEEVTEHFEQKMHHFAQAFSLPFTTIRLIQGFWHLDRKEFEEAMFFLLDPIIRSELASWQHTRIVKALLYQNHHKLALKYIRVKKPPLTTPEDVKLRLTVLLANGLTAEAFEYQRVCRDQGNTEDLLSHLYLGCQQTRNMDRLLQLPLSGVEERHLVRHMKTTTEPHADEILVLHNLQRSRIIEALHLNTKLKHTAVGDVDIISRERSLARQSIVDCYQRVLPKAQRKLAFGLDSVVKRGAVTRKEVTRPAPLSTYVNRAKRTEALSHAMLIGTVLEKVREIKDWDEEPQESTSQEETMVEVPEHPGPFTCTPITPRTRSRICEKSEVVYPSVSQQDPSVYHVPLMSPGKKSTFSSPLSSTMMDSFRPADLSTRRSSRITSAAALSMLQTPPVRKKTPTRPTISAPPSASTPQSILKVRRAGGHAQSPLVAKSTAFDITGAESSLGTPRRLNLDTTAELLVGSSFSRRSLTAQGCSSATSTPKQIRFSVPASPADRSATPSPQPEVTLMGEDTPLRSARDRSPTPERNSPKESPKIDVIRSLRRRKTSEEVNVAMETNETLDDRHDRSNNEVFLDNGSEDVEMEEGEEILPAVTIHRHFEEMEEPVIKRHYEEQQEETISKPVIHRHFEEQSEQATMAEEQEEDVESSTVQRHYEEQDDDEDVVETTLVDKKEAPRDALPLPSRLKKVFYEEMSPVPVSEEEESEGMEEAVVGASGDQNQGKKKTYYEEQESESDGVGFTEIVNKCKQSDNVHKREIISSVKITVTQTSVASDLTVSSSQESSEEAMETQTLESEDAPSEVSSSQPTLTQHARDLDLDNENKHVEIDNETISVSATSSSMSQEQNAHLVRSAIFKLEKMNEDETAEEEAESEALCLCLDDDDEEEGVDTVDTRVTMEIKDSLGESSGQQSNIPQGTEEHPLQAPEFKAPPQPSRMPCLPPTPPTSGMSTPTHEVTPPKADTPSESLPAASTRGTRALTPPRTTRARSRNNSVSRDEVPEPVTPTRKTRASSRGTTPTRTTLATSEGRDVEPVTPTRTRSTRATTPQRTTKSNDEPQEESPQLRTRSGRATTPTRKTKSAHSEDAEELEALPSRSTRGTTPTRKKKEEAEDMETVPSRSTRGTTPTRKKKEEEAEDMETAPSRSTRGTTPTRKTKEAEKMEETEEEPSRTTRATTPTRKTKVNRKDEGMEEGAVTSTRTRRGTTPLRKTRADKTQETIEEAPKTPPQLTEYRTKSDDMDTVQEPVISTRATRGTTPQRRTRASVSEDVNSEAPARTTRATTPPRKAKAEASDEEIEAPLTPTRTTRNSSRASTPTRGTTPPRSTRGRKPKKATAKDKAPVEEEASDMEVEKASQADAAEVKSTSSRTRSRTDSQSLSDAHSTTPFPDDVSDSVSITSTSSRRSRGRPGSRSSSPVTVSDSTTNTNITEKEEEKKAVRPPTPVRRSTRRRTQEVLTADVEKVLNREKDGGAGEGLLSAQSFMMRSRRGQSQEGAPEAPSGNCLEIPTEIPSDVSSTITEDDIVERTNFTFSEPMVVETGKEVHAETLREPISSFVFSPPLTRTRSRKPKSNDLKSKVKMPSILPDAPIDIEKVISRSAKMKSAKRPKSSTVTPAPSDSPINFLPPAEDDELQDDATAPTRRTLRQRPMSLRPKKVTKKKRGELKLW